MADDSGGIGNGIENRNAQPVGLTASVPAPPPSSPVDTQVAFVTIRNRKGLHARASAKFVKCAETFDADVIVLREGQSVGGTSIMGLMMLAAGPGSVLSIRADGLEAEAALAALVALVEDGFGEDCIDD
jgi:phosphocarrier protein HPr